MLPKTGPKLYFRVKAKQSPTSIVEWNKFHQLRAEIYGVNWASCAFARDKLHSAFQLKNEQLVVALDDKSIWCQKITRGDFVSAVEAHTGNTVQGFVRVLHPLSVIGESGKQYDCLPTARKVVNPPKTVFPLKSTHHAIVMKGLGYVLEICKPFHTDISSGYWERYNGVITPNVLHRCRIKLDVNERKYE